MTGPEYFLMGLAKRLSIKHPRYPTYKPVKLMSNITKYSAVKVPVIESERGWGMKIDDYMVCLTTEDAKAFVVEFNSKNTESSAPDWYMGADDTFIPIDITHAQMKKLRKDKRVWLSTLRDLI